MGKLRGYAFFCELKAVASVDITENCGGTPSGVSVLSQLRHQIKNNMASLVAVQPKQPSFSALPSSHSDFNGARLISSIQFIDHQAKPLGASVIMLLCSQEEKLQSLNNYQVNQTRIMLIFPPRYVGYRLLHLKGDRMDFDFVKSSLSAEGFDVVYDINGREAAEVAPILDALPNLEQYIYCITALQLVYTSKLIIYHILRFLLTKNVRLEALTEFADAGDPKIRHKGKLETESLLVSQDVNWTSLRPVYIYGPLSYNPVEEWFFHRLKAGRPIPIPNSGLQITQLGHVKDLAKSFVQVLGNEKASKQVFNISGEKYVTFDGLARACAKAGGFPEPEIVHYNPKEFDFGKKKAFPFRDQHFFTSIEKAKALLGWKPEFD
ncbi:hypothetical protein RND71_006403 [Anisodus tanguticus]|uniref:NAD-dependent epimerase/dehydratase domain-containing protein n=1 Tax=Anisodus tanguticus TaxID=243964 RepID=A0AAE1SW17_9SOLA|nr:hypothetical protein RND71_006403 [Anisodus tanguticus]